MIYIVILVLLKTTNYNNIYYYLTFCILQYKKYIIAGLTWKLWPLYFNSYNLKGFIGLPIYYTITIPAI